MTIRDNFGHEFIHAYMASKGSQGLLWGETLQTRKRAVFRILSYRRDRAVRTNRKQERTGVTSGSMGQRVASYPERRPAGRTTRRSNGACLSARWYSPRPAFVALRRDSLPRTRTAIAHRDSRPRPRCRLGRRVRSGAIYTDNLQCFRFVCGHCSDTERER
jgi:hypothetical protein